MTYSYFTNDICTTDQVVVNTVNVSNGAVPRSASVTFPSAGTFYWRAVYSGDSNNAGAFSPCTSVNGEKLTVSPPPSLHPSISILKLERVGSRGRFTRGPLTGTVGETVFYKIVARDTGETTLKVILRDPICNAGTITPRGIQVITPGHILIYLCRHALTLVTPGHILRNTATVTGVSPQGVKVGPVQSSVVVRVRVLPPAPKPKPVPCPASFTG